MSEHNVFLGNLRDVSENSYDSISPFAPPDVLGNIYLFQQIEGLKILM